MKGQGRIYWRGTAVWIGFYARNATGKAKERRESVAIALGLPVGTATESDARGLLVSRLADVGAGRFCADERRLMVSDLLDGYLTHQQLRLGGKPTPRATVSVIGLIRQDLGPVRVPELTTARLEKWAADMLASGLASGTVHHRIARLSAALRLAYPDRISRLPRLPRVAASPAREGFFSPEEFQRVLAALDDVYADVARFALLSGWREREVLGLRWAQVDRQAGQARLETSKTGTKRILPLEGDVAALIEKRWRLRVCRIGSVQTLTDHVFCRPNGQPVSEWSLRRAWGAACAVAGVRRYFHDLRRTMAREYRLAGVPESEVMRLGGWRTRDVFERYNIVVDEDLRRAMVRRQEAART